MRIRAICFVCLLLAAALPCALRAAENRRSSSVGMPARIDGLVLPGSELEVKPLANRKSPVVLRIVNVYPHGTAFRYDLEWYGLDPGRFDLKDSLRRKDGSATTDLPSIPVEVQVLLPPGQVEPNDLKSKGTPALGGYRLVLAGAIVLWVVGLLAILLVGRRKQRDVTASAARPPTAAERLRPLVEQAMHGTLSNTQRAELERTLLAFWRHRLSLDERRPVEAMALLRAHADAGPLLNQLEAWLHRPGNGEAVDLAALLRPYHDLPGDALEVRP